MKLIYCPKCGDVRKLTKHKWRHCACKASYGRYKPDGWYAEVGGKSIVLGINNNELRRAINFVPGHMDYHFEAFVFPLKHPRIERVEKGDF